MFPTIKDKNIVAKSIILFLAAGIFCFWSYGPEIAYSSGSSLVCTITSGTCSGATIFNMYDSVNGGHAELSNQSNYPYKVCCTGTGVSNSCSGGNHAVALNLSGTTNAHVEESTQNNYTNYACLSATGPVTCNYVSAGDCSSLGTSYACLASISSTTNAHVAACGVYNIQVCCALVQGPSASNFSVSLNNSSTYCQNYLDGNNNLRTGNNGQIAMSFTYNNTVSSAVLSGLEVAIGTSSDVNQATVVTPSFVYAFSATGAPATYNGVSVKMSPSPSLMQIGYGQTYNWWVKLEDSNNIQSSWISAGSFTTPTIHYPLIRVVSDKSLATANTNIQLCSGADISNQSDPCYSVCWTGTPGSAVVDSSNSNWKCSVCYNSSNQQASCSTLSGATYSWIMPAGYQSGTDYTMISGTLTSANPVIKFSNLSSSRKMGLNVANEGEQCGNLSGAQVILPTWKEISPFQ